METVDQVARLSQRALTIFREYFDQVDAQTSEILAMLKNIESQIDYIRNMRDELHRRLLPWEEYIQTWKTVYVVRSDDNTSHVRDLYQFLAPRFMQVHEWVLVTKRGFDVGKRKPLGGIMRW